MITCWMYLKQIFKQNREKSAKRIKDLCIEFFKTSLLTNKKPKLYLNQLQITWLSMTNFMWFLLDGSSKRVQSTRPWYFRSTLFYLCLSYIHLWIIQCLIELIFLEERNLKFILLNFRHFMWKKSIYKYL